MKLSASMKDTWKRFGGYIVAGLILFALVPAAIIADIIGSEEEYEDVYDSVYYEETTTPYGSDGDYEEHGTYPNDEPPEYDPYEDDPYEDDSDGDDLDEDEDSNLPNEEDEDDTELTTMPEDELPDGDIFGSASMERFGDVGFSPATVSPYCCYGWVIDTVQWMPLAPGWYRRERHFTPNTGVTSSGYHTLSFNVRGPGSITLTVRNTHLAGQLGWTPGVNGNGNVTRTIILEDGYSEQTLMVYIEQIHLGWNHIIEIDVTPDVILLDGAFRAPNDDSVIVSFADLFGPSLIRQRIPCNENCDCEGNGCEECKEACNCECGDCEEECDCKDCKEVCNCDCKDCEGACDCDCKDCKEVCNCDCEDCEGACDCDCKECKEVCNCDCEDCEGACDCDCSNCKEVCSCDCEDCEGACDCDCNDCKEVCSCDCEDCEGACDCNCDNCDNNSNTNNNNNNNNDNNNNINNGNNNNNNSNNNQTGGGGSGGSSIPSPTQRTPQARTYPRLEGRPELVIASAEWGDAEPYAQRFRRNFVQGYPNGTFNPNGHMTRAEMIQLFFNISSANPTSVVSATTRFNDIEREAWFFYAVAYLENRGAIQGFPDMTLRPNEPITNAEFATLTVQFFNLADIIEPDMLMAAESHWGANYINLGFARGWFEYFGITETFDPDAPILRAQAVALLNFYQGRVPCPVAINAYLARSNRNMLSDLRRGHWSFYEIIEAALARYYYENSYGNTTWLRVVN